ncbi:MAG: type II toxin-antitoxin system MqsA family antitoxin [Treponema sp.]|nr:type II toxin-antitoxin system MqsA family antitoxin [Treponema sp.]
MSACFFCKNGTVEKSFTTYMVDLKDCIIIVRNVPCEECTQCGEKYFTDEVMERLEQIVKKVREIASEVFVTDYSKLAA